VWNGDVEPVGNLIEVWVQIRGIPPKWVDWDTIREVASILGLMIEVDWQAVFNSFFSLVRVKILCKDPTKIPRARLYVFKTGVYKVSFKPEGFVQVDNSSEGDSGGVEELEEDDLLDDDDPKDNLKGDDVEPKQDNGHGASEGKLPEKTDKPQEGVVLREVVLQEVASLLEEPYYLKMMTPLFRRTTWLLIVLTCWGLWNWKVKMWKRKY
jgi:hypothetical protein